MKPMKPAGIVLAANLKALMDARTDRNSQPKVAAASGGALDQTTVGRALKGKNSTTLRSLDGLATAFGRPVWSLLVPGINPIERPVAPTDPELRAEVDRQVLAKLKLILPEAEAFLALKDEEEEPAAGQPVARDAIAHRQSEEGKRPVAIPAKGKKRR